MPTPALRSAQMLALAFMSMIVFLGVVVYLSVPDADLALPSTYVIGGQVVAGVVVALLVSTIGFRAAPIAPGTDPEKMKGEALQKHQMSVILRLVLCELVALVSVTLAFILTEGQVMTYVIGGIISLTLMGLFAYPSAGNIRRVEASLDSAGAQSRLAETFAAPSGTSL